MCVCAPVYITYAHLSYRSTACFTQSPALETFTPTYGMCLVFFNFALVLYSLFWVLRGCLRQALWKLESFALNLSELLQDSASFI